MSRLRTRRSEHRRRGVRNLLFSVGCFDLGGDHRDAVFLAGSARSGTTWLSGLLNPEGEMRYVFEPFYPEKVAAFRGLIRRPYLRPDDPGLEYLRPVRAVLSGRVKSRWSDRHNRTFLARRRLVKEVRANLMLGWLTKAFPGMKVVFLLRHPCAVVESRLRLGWRDGLDDFTAQATLLEDYPEPLESLLPTAKSDFERGILAWCIENYVPLSQLRAADTKNVHVLRYEELLLSPERELSRLYQYLHPDEPDVFRITLKEIEELPREELAFGWKSRVSEGLRAQTSQTLAAFGLNALYDEDALPRPGGLESFLSGAAFS
ncbi:MAG: sulfotransferase family protein [Rubrobacter sp.]